MTNQWFRLYSEFATDPKVQMLSEINQRRLIMLFCMRCNGDVTLHDDEIAFQLRISNEEWQATKALFIDKNFIDEVNNVLNWDKRQYRSDSSSERVARHRSKVKQACNVTVTPPEAEQIQNRTDTESTTHSAAQARDPNSFQIIFDAGSAVFPSLLTANTSAIHQWIAAGCDPHLDAVPEIQRHAKAGKAVKAWSYFTGGIMDAYATRITPPPKGNPNGNHRAPTSSKSSVQLAIEATERARAAREQRSPEPA